MAIYSPEKSLAAPRSVETGKLVVRQPAKLAELSKLLETFENLNARVSERTGEDVSADMGGGGVRTGGGQQGGTGPSPRDIAIANIPPAEVVKLRLEKHIQKEVKKLEKSARAASRSSKPGSAYKLNEIYAKIRRMNALLAEIFEASYEVLKRLFIRVFIDQQAVL